MISGRRRLAKCPLDALLARGQITVRQYQAAYKYRALWTAAAWEMPLPSAYVVPAGHAPRPGSRRTSPVEKAAFARNELAGITQTLGRIAENVLTEIVVHERTTREFALAHDLGRDGGLPPLRLTLDALADLMGIKP